VAALQGVVRKYRRQASLMKRHPSRWLWLPVFWIATMAMAQAAGVSPIIDLLLSNFPPSVAITAPPDNILLGAPGTVNLTATATGVEGAISKVEFYRGATLLQTVTTPPYQASDLNVSVGNYAYTAKAYDSQQNTTTSPAVNVSVVARTPMYFIST